MLMKLSLLIILFNLPFLFAYSTNFNYGLYLKSYPVKGSEMSGLMLEEGKPIPVKGTFSMTYDLYVRDECVFGNVCRMITDKNEFIDFMFTVSNDDRRFPMLTVNEKTHPFSTEIVRNRWIPVTVDLSPEKSEITLTVGKEKQTVGFPVKDIKNVRIVFGVYPVDKIGVSEIASTNIRNIRIMEDGELMRYWKLEKHNAQYCYDSVKHVTATAINPRWLIDDHITWQKVYEEEYPLCPSVTFDPKSGTFYLVNDSKSLHLFHTDKQTSETIAVRNGNLIINSPNQLTFLPDGQLAAYNMDENLFAFFSFADRTWSTSAKPSKEHSYWNNAVSYSPADSSLVSFGGYGFYRYNNELVKMYPYGNKSPLKVQLSEITPRYNCASAIVGNTLYILGGRGSKTGKQELSTEYSYDFYAVDLKTQHVNRLWKANDIPANGHFTPGENMIYDKDKDCFYLLATQNEGLLMKINARDSIFEPMSLPMGLNFEAQYLYVNLYLCPSQKKLYALVNKTRTDNTANISIYTINYPPVSVTDLMQPVPEQEEAGYKAIIFFAGLIVLLVASYSYIYRQKQRKAMDRQRTGKDERAEQMKKPEKTEKTEEAERTSEPAASFVSTDHSYYDFSKSCICLLGGFMVIDKDGNDITGVFTPTLKQLLIMLILHTGENPKGIAGHKMIQLLWYDKSEESAKNNRNVYLSRLRAALEKVGAIEVITQNGFYSIQFNEDVTCDYLEALHQYQLISENPNSSQQFGHLPELLLRGTMLPNTEIDWVDKFKSDFSNQTIDTLTILMKKENLDNNLRIKIIDTILQHDYINEEALQAKCIILCQSGKMGLAKNIYDNFCKEYANTLGTPYKRTLTELIEGEIN